jgi:hypothetical protein
MLCHSGKDVLQEGAFPTTPLSYNKADSARLDCIRFEFCDFALHLYLYPGVAVAKAAVETKEVPKPKMKYRSQRTINVVDIDTKAVCPIFDHEMICFSSHCFRKVSKGSTLLYSDVTDDVIATTTAA